MDTLIRASYADVYALCRRLLGDSSDAADATQEVYLRVVRAVMGFRGEAAFGTWLHRVTVNVCMTALRRRGDVRARGQSAGAVDFAADELLSEDDGPDVGLRRLIWQVAPRWRWLDFRTTPARSSSCATCKVCRPRRPPSCSA